MTSQYDEHMKRWGGLESSFDGTVPPSRLAPVVLMRKDIEAYDGSRVFLKLSLGRSGLFHLEADRPVWKANAADMLAFFKEGLAAMEAMLKDADEPVEGLK